VLAQAPDDAGAVPLLAARVASVTALLLAGLVARPSAPAAGAVGVALVAGTLDMTANGLFIWSTLDGELAIVGALVSLFPVTTVLLAVVVLGERLDRLQLAGLGLAVAAAAMLS
jgi:drug/metabolite transporter (DMT)-like permease